MRMPDIVKVGAHNIRIKRVSAEDVTGPGQYVDYFNLIKIRHDSDTPEDSEAEALLHEILEAVNRKNNLSLDHTVLSVISESLFPTEAMLIS